MSLFNRSQGPNFGRRLHPQLEASAAAFVRQDFYFNVRDFDTDTNLLVTLILPDGQAFQWTYRITDDHSLGRAACLPGDFFPGAGKYQLRVAGQSMGQAQELVQAVRVNA